MKKVELMEAIDREFGRAGSWYEFAKENKSEFAKDDFGCYLYHARLIIEFVKGEVDRFFTEDEEYCSFYDLNFEFKDHYRFFEELNSRPDKYDITNRLIDSVIRLMDEIMGYISRKF